MHAFGLCTYKIIFKIVTDLTERKSSLHDVVSKFEDSTLTNVCFVLCPSGPNGFSEHSLIWVGSGLAIEQRQGAFVNLQEGIKSQKDKQFIKQRAWL